jgi:hypothetical protein
MSGLAEAGGLVLKSRRAVLGGLAAAPFIALPVAAAQDGSASPGETAMNMHSTIRYPVNHRSAWNRAMTRHEAAKIAGRQFDERVYEPMLNEIDLRAPRPDLIIHVRRAAGRTQEYDIDIHELDALAEDEEYGEYVRPLRTAWHDYLSRKQAAEQELNSEAIEKRWQELVDEESDAHTDLLMLPAPDLAALRWKLAEVIEPGDSGHIVCWCDEVRLAIVADYEQLLHDQTA